MWPVGPGQDGTIYLDNLRTRHLGWATPVVDPGEYQPIMLVGGWIVYVVNGGVTATDAVTGKTRLLGSALYFAPSATPGHVWLYAGQVAQSVSVVTGHRSRPITLPHGSQLVAGTDAGLVLAAGNRLELWHPGTTPRTLPRSTSARGFAVSARLVAYDTGCASEGTAQNLSYDGNFGYYACSRMQIYDVVTGRLLSFAAPPGTSGWVPGHGDGGSWSASAIAPSGAVMAAEAVVQPDSQGIAREFVLQLSGRDSRAAAVPSSAAFLLSVTDWSAHGSWLFYQGPGQRMWAYQVATGQVRASGTRCCQYLMMATLGSPPG